MTRHRLDTIIRAKHRGLPVDDTICVHPEPREVHLRWVKGKCIFQQDDTVPDDAVALVDAPDEVTRAEILKRLTPPVLDAPPPL